MVNSATERIVVQRVKATDELVVHIAKHKGVLFTMILNPNYQSFCI